MQLEMKRSLLIISLSLISFTTKAQDSNTYIQNDAAMFSNRYIFNSDGTFKHFFITDDGQVWYGRGNYFNKGKYRTLYFKDADTTMNEYNGWRIHYETNFQRVLVKKGYGFKSFEKNSNTGKPGVRLKKTAPN
ncbi:hypothetical protein AAY42_13860 [Flagellimonas eckloniae]|uniref:Nicotinic acid mononucleotide adenyltransferase n=2 Tax=Flagellimonas eckloniae TaxID=346185 RepID=A0A0Q1BJK5_9FLAO|nr:hypothetical protein AAY42_13860 [Allomuricauda eckloniae]